MGCDLDVVASADLAAALKSAAEGATVCLAAGTYDGPVSLSQAVTIRAADGVKEGAVIIDGMGAGPVVKIAPGARVTLEGLTLTGGEAEIGGGLQLLGGTHVTLVRCRLESLAASAKGGAVYVEEGTLVATRTTFRDNRASTGGAVAVEGTAQARFEGCLFVGNQGSRGAAISAHDGARVEVIGSTFARNAGDSADLNVRGSMSRAPEVSVTGGIFEGGITQRPAGAVTVKRSAFGPDAAGFTDDAGNVQGALDLDKNGRVGDGSVAKGMGFDAED
ncbi:MAG: hypothetical protein ACI9MR_004180 [Myxococcota bacterium]|jgi:hypothetical protein